MQGYYPCHFVLIAMGSLLSRVKLSKQGPCLQNTYIWWCSWRIIVPLTSGSLCSRSDAAHHKGIGFVKWLNTNYQPGIKSMHYISMLHGYREGLIGFHLLTIQRHLPCRISIPGGTIRPLPWVSHWGEREPKVFTRTCLKDLAVPYFSISPFQEQPLQLTTMARPVNAPRMKQIRRLENHPERMPCFQAEAW